MTLYPPNNPLDPLTVVPSTPRDVFMRWSRQAEKEKIPLVVVVDAAAALIINAVRQDYSNWHDAERAFDELFGRMKQVLKDHYDANGRKKGIFPYDQEIQAAFVRNKSNFFRQE
jgi:hypothetical protein